MFPFGPLWAFNQPIPFFFIESRLKFTIYPANSCPRLSTPFLTLSAGSPRRRLKNYPVLILLPFSDPNFFYSPVFGHFRLVAQLHAIPPFIATLLKYSAWIMVLCYEFFIDSFILVRRSLPLPSRPPGSSFSTLASCAKYTPVLQMTFPITESYRSGFIGPPHLRVFKNFVPLANSWAFFLVTTQRMHSLLDSTVLRSLLSSFPTV